MSGTILILRPQPGADETAARAREVGLTPAVAPLFTIRALDWEPPEPADFDAVMLTSANAPRHAGTGLDRFLQLPCYAVGETTAAAARIAGFTDVRTGSSDGAALLSLMAADGIHRAFHPCGRHRTALPPSAVRLDSVSVYVSVAAEQLPPEGDAALAAGALVLLHSPRAAGAFAALAGSRRNDISVCAISAAAADAAGDGWKSLAVASRPRDDALLALAAELCQTRPR